MESNPPQIINEKGPRMSMADAEDFKSSGGEHVKDEVTTGSHPVRPPASLRLPYKGSPLPPELTQVIEAWPTLPEAIRAGIVTMVITTTGSAGD